MELYGKKTRCIYCGISDKTDFKMIVMSVKGKEDTAMVCSKECENAVLDCCRFVERGYPFFISGVIISILIAISSGIFSSFFKTSSIYLANIGILIAGVTIIFFPFVTPETNKILGLKNGMLLGRMCGVILLITGIFFMFK